MKAPCPPPTMPMRSFRFLECVMAVIVSKACDRLKKPEGPMRRRFWMAACLMSLGMRLPAAEREVTFSRDVAPILYQHCVSCHHPNDIAPMSLLTYKEARPWAAAIKEAVLSRKMPPWKADPHYGKWANDPSLTADEVRTITAWADGSKAEGDPKLRPAPPQCPDGWKIGKPDIVFAIPQQKLEGKGLDVHVTVMVPTN